MGAWATAQDISDNDKRFSEKYVARQESKVTMLADARRYPCEINLCLGFLRLSKCRPPRDAAGELAQGAAARPRMSRRFIAGCELAKALDLVLDHPNNLHDLGGPRMKRFAVRLGVESHASDASTRLLDSHRSVSTQAFYDDGVLKSLSVAEGPKGSDGLHSDPAGDDAPESTFAENFLKTI